MNKPKTEMLEFNVNWNSIKRACMRTIGKEAGPKEPNQKWKKSLLICRHSPLRKGSITWKWPEIPYAISTHFVRHHIGVEKFISTSRADRTEIKDRSQRSQMDAVSMEMDANIEALLNISERRLCTCADATTTAYWKDLKDLVATYDTDIAWAMVPQCVRCGSCVEPFSDCKFYEKLMEGHALEEQQDIMKRYDIYNDFYQKHLTLTKKKQG